MNMLPFKLPSPVNTTGTPQWNGTQFIIDAECHDVLEYNENFAGWSDELTHLHEDNAGDSHPMDRASGADLLEQIAQDSVPPGTVILEIGCSSGYVLKALKLAYPQAMIIGTDVVKAPLYVLAKELPGVPLIRSDLLQSPIPDNSIDIIVLLNVLEHIEQDTLALKKIYSLLKPGGKLIIEVPAAPYLYDHYDETLCHYRRYSAKELEQKIKAAGFIITRRSHLGFLIFPAFMASKFLSKWLKSDNKEKKTARQIQKSAHSTVLKLLMHFERRYLSQFKLPCGIRVLMTAKKM